MKTKTEENMSEPKPDLQERIYLGDSEEAVWVDKEMIPLLRALNSAGLITRSHCSGHGLSQAAWVAIRGSNVLGVEVRRDLLYDEIILTWKPSWIKDKS